MTDRPNTPILDRVHVPADMKGLSDAQLRRLAPAGTNRTVAPSMPADNFEFVATAS